MRKYFLILIIIELMFLNEIRSQSSNCVVNRVQNQNSFIIETVLYFQCYPPTSNSVFQIPFGSNPNDFTQIVMSPNTYTSLPMLSICQFRNINLLDASSNQLTSISGLIQTINCLINLKTLKLSNNFISTGLQASDFDDYYSQQLVSIDFSNNQIPSIASNVFIRSDGSIRFTNLINLNLKNNQIKQLDLQWPLTIPSTSLFVDLSSNPISNLVNDFNKTYSSSVFAYPVTGNRRVNIQNNQIKVFGDSNLIQYGLSSVNDLNSFLSKISKYDFRQSNASNLSTINCSCSSSSSLTNTWYKELLAASLINSNELIIQLYCANVPNTFPLNIDCSVSLIL